MCPHLVHTFQGGQSLHPLGASIMIFWAAVFLNYQVLVYCQIQSSFRDGNRYNKTSSNYETQQHTWFGCLSPAPAPRASHMFWQPSATQKLPPFPSSLLQVEVGNSSPYLGLFKAKRFLHWCPSISKRFPRHI